MYDSGNLNCTPSFIANKTFFFPEVVFSLFRLFMLLSTEELFFVCALIEKKDKTLETTARYVDTE